MPAARGARLAEPRATGSRDPARALRRRTSCSTAARRSSSPASRSRRSTSRAIRPATSRSTPTGRSSRATCCSPARSAAPTSRSATGNAARVDPRRSSTASRRTPSSTPGHGPETTLGAELATNPFLAELRVVVKFEAPSGTHDVLPAEQPLWQRVTGDGRRRLRGLRLPADHDAGLRGHRALRADLGRGLGHRPEGDVHVHRPRRPLADAAARGARRRSRAPTSSTACTASRSRVKLSSIGPMYRYAAPQRGRSASSGS